VARVPAQNKVTSFRVIPRSSAAKKNTHTQNNLPCPPRSQHSCLQFQPPRTPLLLRSLFRVFRGERWFPVANTVIEQSHARLARAKAHATVAGPRCHECARKTRSRHSAFFRGQKKRHTHDLFSVSSVVRHGFRLQTPLLNKRMRYLRGLKPTLRFLDRAIRGHVIPRFSAAKKGSTRNPVRSCRLHCQSC
jgi:hypothetical protein